MKMHSVTVELKPEEKRTKIGELFQLENKVVFKVNDIIEDNYSSIVREGLFVNYMTMYEVFNY